MIDQPTHSRSAWSISMLFHICAILALALFLAMAPRAMPSDEPGRPASIVLKLVDQNQTVEYFDGSENSDSAVESSSTGGPAGAMDSVEDALPPESSSIELAELPEPELLGPLASTPEVNIASTNRTEARTLGSGNDQAVIDADLAEQRRRAAGKPSGPPADVSLFGSSAVSGHRFAFVIDRSKSMGGEGLGVLEAADGQLAGALERLRSNHSFQIIAYNDRLARYPAKEMATATEPEKRKAIEFVRGLAAFRSTEHGLALLAAAHTKADVIFLLTDGGYPEPLPSEMRDIVKTCSGRATIHALQFGFGPPKADAPFMRDLARQTGGSYSYVDANIWK